MESRGAVKQDGAGLHGQGPQERGQRGPKKRRKGRKDTNHCTSAWSHEVWPGVANPICPLRGWSWLMLEGVLERRCHCAAFGHSACLLTKPLAEEERGCAEPRLSSKSRVTTLMAHPTQIYRIESWESGPSPSHEGLNRKRHFLSAMPRPSESRDPHWRRKGRWAPKNGPPSSLLSTLRMLSKLHCLNDGTGASQTSGKLGCRAGSPSLIRLSMPPCGSTSFILRTLRRARSQPPRPLDCGRDSSQAAGV